MAMRGMIPVVLALSMAGCGVVYTSPQVRDGSPLGDAKGTDYDVEVIVLTEETARAANLQPYIPARLPLALQPGAAERTRNVVRSSVPDTLIPPPEPQFLPERRPEFIPDRFPPLAAPEPYRIGPADVVLLSVNAPATLNDLPALINAQSKRQGYVVQDDGSIAIPDVGRVQIGGLTTPDAEAAIFRALVAAGIDPSFSLEVAEFNSQRISVGGDVGSPQLVPITLTPLYLHEAIQAAGGLRVSDPSVAKVQLFRGNEVYQIGGERFLSDPTARQVVMRDGDSIQVVSEFSEAAAQLFFDQQLALRQSQIQQTQSALTLTNVLSQVQDNELQRLAEERAIFERRLELGAVEQNFAYVTGEVRRAQRVPLPFERRASLAEVMFHKDIQGLAIETADFSEIYVIRAASDPRLMGKLTAYHLNAENAVNFASATRLEIHPNDVVFVAEQPITSWNRVISQILPQIFLQAANVASN